MDGGSTANYKYNALNLRVQSAVGSATTEYVFNSSGQRVFIWDAVHGTQLQGQYYWGSTPVAYYKGGTLHFQHQDWEGTERMRTSYSASQEGYFQSLPFGDGQNTVGADTDAHHFGALDHDSETDTDHAQFRQYSNVQGRWHSPDPYYGSYDVSNPQSLNRYAYAMNNPLAFVDPLGLAPQINCYASPDGEALADTVGDVDDYGDDSPIKVGDVIYDSVEGETCNVTGGWGQGAEDDDTYTLYVTTWECDSVRSCGVQVISAWKVDPCANGYLVCAMPQSNQQIANQLWSQFQNLPKGPSGGGAPNNNNLNQPPTKIEKQMCQDAANQFVAKYNQQNQNLRQSVVVGGGAGIVSSIGGALTGIYYGLRYNWAVSNTLNTMAYQSCMGTSNIPWSLFTNY